MHRACPMQNALTLLLLLNACSSGSGDDGNGAVCEESRQFYSIGQSPLECGYDERAAAKRPDAVPFDKNGKPTAPVNWICDCWGSEAVFAGGRYTGMQKKLGSNEYFIDECSSQPPSFDAAAMQLCNGRDDCGCTACRPSHNPCDLPADAGSPEPAEDAGSPETREPLLPWQCRCRQFDSTEDAVTQCLDGALLCSATDPVSDVALRCAADVDGGGCVCSCKESTGSSACMHPQPVACP